MEGNVPVQIQLPFESESDTILGKFVILTADLHFHYYSMVICIKLFIVYPRHLWVPGKAYDLQAALRQDSSYTPP